MRLQDLNIPSLDPKPIEDRLVNRFTRRNNSFYVHLPVLSYAYSDQSMSLADQRQGLERDLQTVKDYLLENSYGRFSLEYRIFDVDLRLPKAYRGNLEGKVPRYDPRTHELLNPADFPPHDSYTGWDPFEVMAKNPAVVPKERNEVFRDYTRIFRRNILETAINGARSQGPSRPHPSSLDSTLEWALRSGSTGHLMMVSQAINRSVVRGDFPRLGVGNGRSIHEIAMNSAGPWGVHAHELGHLILGQRDHYNRTVVGGQTTAVNTVGFIGNAGLMGFGGGSDIHLSAAAKFELGWLDPVVLEPSFHAQTVRLSPVYLRDTHALLIRPQVERKPGELFLVEVRTKEGKRYTGGPLLYDQNLGPDLDNSVVVYHVDTTDNVGGPVATAEPYLDVEGETPGSTRVVGLRPGDGLDLTQTAFHGGAESGLELEVLSAEPDGTHEIRIRWNQNPKLVATRTSPGGHLHVFTRGADGRPLYKRRGNGWIPSQTGWSELGGRITHTPGLSADVDVLDVYVRGTSTRPFHKRRLANGDWVPGPREWTMLGGEILGSPSATVSSSAEVVVRGVSGNAFHKARSGGSWEPGAQEWTPLGGPIEGSPVVVTASGEIVYVFSRRPDGTPIYKWREGGSWRPGPTEWRALDGRIDADPTAVRVDDTVYVAVRGTSGKTFVRHIRPGRPVSPWTDLGGQSLGPVACAPGDGEAFVFVTGISRRVFCKRGRGRQWDAEWTDLGGAAIGTPAVAWRNGRLDVLVVGISGRVFRKHFDGQRWSAEWENLGGEIL